MSECELIERIKAGDQDAFREFYDQYARLVYRYTIVRVKNPQDAEDITSEVFSRAWYALPSFQWEGTPVKAWLLRIAYNLIVDRYRKKREWADLLPWKAAYREHRFAQIEHQDLLRQILLDLSYEEQVIIHLEFFEGYTLKEVSELLGKSANAVRVQKHRALKRMRKALEETQSQGTIPAFAAKRFQMPTGS